MRLPNQIVPATSDTFWHSSVLPLSDLAVCTQCCGRQSALAYKEPGSYDNALFGRTGRSGYYEAQHKWHPHRAVRRTGVVSVRVFIIDTANLGFDLRGGLIGIAGGTQATADEKLRCVEEVSRYVVDGWAIAADPSTPLGRLAALAAAAGCVPFVGLNRAGAEVGWPALTPQPLSTPDHQVER